MIDETPWKSEAGKEERRRRRGVSATNFVPCWQVDTELSETLIQNLCFPHRSYLPCKHTTKLDYCNSTDLPATEINRLQRIQKQCSQAGSEEIKMRPRFASAPAFALATHSCTDWLQNCSTGLSSLRRLITAVPFFSSCYWPALSLTEI